MPYLILTSVISIIVALLALQNGANTSLNFILWQFEIPLICVILGSFLAGALVSSLILMYSKLQHLVTNYKNNQEIKRLNKQVDDLKANIALLTEPVHTVNVESEEVKVEDATTTPVDKPAEEKKSEEVVKVQ
ncbi:MAG: LapA family protein [Acidaminococcaceae bacterium]|nr:LapA family protein [Acidaminococcaceae bacterium]MDO4935374.1 LapA family protein [Phascolarctobacterium sp.]